MEKLEFTVWVWLEDMKRFYRLPNKQRSLESAKKYLENHKREMAWLHKNWNYDKFEIRCRKVIYGNWELV